MHAADASSIPPVDMRDAFFDALCEVAASQPDVVILTGDHGAFSLDRFAAEHPGRVINMGIAEQNILGVAAGLAHSGKRVVVYGINNFVTLRALEQVAMDVAAMSLPVNIVGVGAGFTYASDGPTHHGVMEIAAMRAIPGMSIWNATDARQSSLLAEMALQDAGPKYLRIEKGGLPDLYRDRQLDLSKGMATLRDGNDLVIVGTGVMTHRAMELAAQLEQDGLSARVVDVFCLKPVCTTSLQAALKGVAQVVTLEENMLEGGLGELVAGHMAEQGSGARLLRKGIPNQFLFQYGDRAFMQRQVGLDLESLLSEIRSACDKSAGK